MNRTKNRTGQDLSAGSICCRAKGERPMKLFAVVLGLGLSSAIGAAQGLKCSMQDYKAVDGVKAVADAGSVTLTWQGEAQQQLRAQFALRDGQPMVAELAAKAGGGWIMLGKD